MISHNLPGFLAGPMPVPGWPKDENSITITASVIPGAYSYSWYRVVSQSFFSKSPKEAVYVPIGITEIVKKSYPMGSTAVKMPRKCQRGKNAGSRA